MRHYCQSPSALYTHNFFVIGLWSESYLPRGPGHWVDSNR